MKKVLLTLVLMLTVVAAFGQISRVDETMSNLTKEQGKAIKKWQKSIKNKDMASLKYFYVDSDGTEHEIEREKNISSKSTNTVSIILKSKDYFRLDGAKAKVTLPAGTIKFIVSMDETMYKGIPEEIFDDVFIFDYFAVVKCEVYKDTRRIVIGSRGYLGGLIGNKDDNSHLYTHLLDGDVEKIGNGKFSITCYDVEPGHYAIVPFSFGAGRVYSFDVE